MGKIFYVMGKSSSGKDTIYGKLMGDKQLKLRTLTGYTTRPMREGETDGREYFFVTKEEMEELNRNGSVIEMRGYDTIYGMWYYFTVNDEQVDLKQYNYILIGTLESYEKVRNYYGSDVVVPIYIQVEDGERLSRALARERMQLEPRYDELCRRFLADAKDFSAERISQLGIEKIYENVYMEECYEQIKSDIIKEING
ncbi:MAG: guanylate kinase [Lachnospiraceae bacterium]|nr:guanylate kinase [Lachnospiraceae bacterium]